MNIVAGSTMSDQRAVSVRNCSCTHDEQVLAREAAAHAVAVRADHQRVLVLDQQRVHRRAVPELRASPVRTLPTRLMSSTRIDGIDARRGPRSASCSSDTCRGWTTARRRPRTARRRSPRAGSSPRACWRRRCGCGEAVAGADEAALRLAVQRARTPRSRSTGRPVIAAAHSGAARRRCASSSSGQSV